MSTDKLCLLFIFSRNKAVERNSKLVSMPSRIITRNSQSLNHGFKSLVVFTFFGFLLLNKLSAQPSSRDADWTRDTLVNGVNFYHSIANCNGKNVVFLKFDNRNNYKVEISWKEVFETQVNAKTEGFSGQKEIIIPPGITAPLSCTDVGNKKNIIQASEVNPMYVAEIRKFEFKNINVTPAN